MSNREYPRFGNGTKPNPKNIKQTQFKKCFVCGLSPASRRDVQVNWFRGDDEVPNLCISHWDDMEAIVNKWREKK